LGVELYNGQGHASYVFDFATSKLKNIATKSEKQSLEAVLGKSRNK
jgi:hypothetical protein